MSDLFQSIIHVTTDGNMQRKCFICFNILLDYIIIFIWLVRLDFFLYKLMYFCLTTFFFYVGLINRTILNFLSFPLVFILHFRTVVIVVDCTTETSPFRAVHSFDFLSPPVSLFLASTKFTCLLWIRYHLFEIHIRLTVAM